MRKFFIQTQEGEVVAMCNDFSIEFEKAKLPTGSYILIGPSCCMSFEVNK